MASINDSSCDAKYNHTKNELCWFLVNKLKMEQKRLLASDRKIDACTLKFINEIKKI